MVALKAGKTKEEMEAQAKAKPWIPASVKRVIVLVVVGALGFRYLYTLQQDKIEVDVKAKLNEDL